MVVVWNTDTNPSTESYGGLDVCILKINNNNNKNRHENVYGAVIMTSHCESSPGSSDECTLSARWLPTLRPSQSTWAVSPPKIGSYHPHPPLPLSSLLSLQADTHFTVPQRVEGWVDLSTAVKVHSPCSRLYTAAAVAINTTVSGVIRTWILSHCSQMC